MWPERLSLILSNKKNIFVPVCYDINPAHASFITGPLTVDTTNSSPVAIYAPKNPQLRLKCVFKGGEPPIRITLKRNDELISRVQGRDLNLLLMPSWFEEIAGRYICRAVDAKNAVAVHEITVNVPGATTSFLHAIY